MILSKSRWDQPLPLQKYICNVGNTDVEVVVWRNHQDRNKYAVADMNMAVSEYMMLANGLSRERYLWTARLRPVWGTDNITQNNVQILFDFSNTVPALTKNGLRFSVLGFPP